MRSGAGVVTALTAFTAGTLLLSACGPTAGAPAVDAPRATSAPASSSSTPATTTTKQEAPTTTTAAPSPTTEAPAYIMTSGAKGDQVRELQARLKQLEWYDGNVTGAYDDVTTAAVRGFQDKRGIPESGSVDDATWAKLTSMTREPTTEELTNVLTAGPALLKQGSTGAKVRDLQARLKQIGWWSGDVSDAYGSSTAAAVKAFQGKRQIPVTGEVDQRTLDKLNAMTRTPTSDELNNVKPAAAPVPATNLDPRCMTGHVMCISKASRTLTWVIDGQPQMKLAVRFGSEYTPTREGVFSVFQKNREWTSTLYGSPMPYSMFFSGGQAVHYSSDFAARGYSGASHGCVNVRDLAGIASLFGQVNLGDKVVVY